MDKPDLKDTEAINRRLSDGWVTTDRFMFQNYDKKLNIPIYIDDGIRITNYNDRSEQYQKQQEILLQKQFEKNMPSKPKDKTFTIKQDDDFDHYLKILENHSIQVRLDSHFHQINTLKQKTSPAKAKLLKLTKSSKEFNLHPKMKPDKIDTLTHLCPDYILMFKKKIQSMFHQNTQYIDE